MKYKYLNLEPEDLEKIPAKDRYKALQEIEKYKEERHHLGYVKKAGIPEHPEDKKARKLKEKKEKSKIIPLASMTKNQAKRHRKKWK